MTNLIRVFNILIFLASLLCVAPINAAAPAGEFSVAATSSLKPPCKPGVEECHECFSSSFGHEGGIWDVTLKGACVWMAYRLLQHRQITPGDEIVDTIKWAGVTLFLAKTIELSLKKIDRIVLTYLRSYNLPEIESQTDAAAATHTPGMVAINGSSQGPKNILELAGQQNPVALLDAADSLERPKPRKVKTQGKKVAAASPKEELVPDEKVEIDPTAMVSGKGKKALDACLTRGIFDFREYMKAVCALIALADKLEVALPSDLRRQRIHPQHNKGQGLDIVATGTRAAARRHLEEMSMYIKSKIEEPTDAAKGNQAAEKPTEFLLYMEKALTDFNMLLQDAFVDEIQANALVARHIRRSLEEMDLALADRSELESYLELIEKFMHLPTMATEGAMEELEKCFEEFKRASSLCEDFEQVVAMKLDREKLLPQLERIDQFDGKNHLVGRFIKIQSGFYKDDPEGLAKFNRCLQGEKRIEVKSTAGMNEIDGLEIIWEGTIKLQKDIQDKERLRCQESKKPFKKPYDFEFTRRDLEQVLKEMVILD